MRGFLGLIFDGAAGFAFQAPIYVLGILGIARWRRLPESARLALFSSVAYLLLLVIRDEWHGGWSPPLRYVVFLTPFLLLSAAGVVDRWKNSLILVLAGAWTLLLSIRGIGMPWTLFRIADGENFAGVHLSRLYSSDFSRLFPSLIRPNTAAIVAVSAGAVIFLLYAVFRDRSPRLPGMPALGAAFVCCAFSAMVMTGTRPGRVVHFEDSHIKREGGSLYPEEYTVARFRFHGGWEMQAGDAISFRYRGGRSAIFYRSAEGAVLTIGGSALALPPTGRRWDEVRFTMPAPENRIAVRVARTRSTSVSRAASRTASAGSAMRRTDSVTSRAPELSSSLRIFSRMAARFGTRGPTTGSAGGSGATTWSAEISAAGNFASANRIATLVPGSKSTGTRIRRTPVSGRSRTMRTGTSDRRTTFSAVEPSSIRSNAE